MIKDIYINTDGSIEVYDTDNCRVNGFFFMWSLQDLINCWDISVNGKISNLPYEYQVVQNPNFYFKICNSNETLSIPNNHIKKFLKYIDSEPQVDFESLKQEETPQPSNN